MTDWNSLLDETALAALLPEAYARFARPVREGLVLFLSELPEKAQFAIVSKQTSLPLTASISERLALLARSCPVLHKLAQVLARDQRLAPELREHLRELESLPPTVPENLIHNELVKELGPLERLGIQLSPPALAEASVAVVIPFVALEPKDRNSASGGVFKLLKPGIEDRLELELELLSQVGAHFDRKLIELDIPAMDYEELFEQIREKLRHEVCLDQEQCNLLQAADVFADQPLVHIPALLPHCTPRVTAMERIEGVKVTDRRFADPLESRQLAELIVHALVAGPIFSRGDHAMFHADPHAGNLMATHDKRLAILDWSLVGFLGEPERLAIVQMVQSAITLDARRIAEILESLNTSTRVDSSALYAIVQASLKQIRQGRLPGLAWLVDLLDDAVHVAGLRVASDLMLMRKSLHTLEGVVAEIGDGAVELDDVLMNDFLRNFARELPRRYVAEPSSRDFATRISNLDLMHLWLSGPTTVARYWLGSTLDLLDAFRPAGKLHDQEV